MLRRLARSWRSWQVGFSIPTPPLGSIFPGIGNAIDTFGLSLGFGAGTGIGGLAPGVTILDAAIPGAFTTASLSAVLGAVGIGAFAGGLLASLTGGNQLGGTIGGGLGAIAGKVWRVGLMGYSSSPEKILFFMSCLSHAIAAEGHATDLKAGLAAAMGSLEKEPLGVA